MRPSGIIAMKLEDGEAIVDVQICTEKDDVLLTANGGQCIRFAVPEVRVFQGRTSRGVRGITLADKDRVISLSILLHIDVTAEERAAYLKRASAVRRGRGEEEVGSTDTEEAVGAIELGEKRYVELSAAEQFVLTVSERGFGKRSSSYEYRTTGRGGKGIVAMSLTKKTGRIVGIFPRGRSRSGDAGDRCRQAHPHTGVRHPHCGALDARCDRAQYRRRRTRRVARTAV